LSTYSCEDAGDDSGSRGRILHSTWAVGDCERLAASCCVCLVSLDNGGWSRAESCVGSNNSGDNRSAVTSWRRRNARSWCRNWLGDLARAIRDCQCLRRCGGIRLAVGGDGRGNGAEGGIGENSLSGPRNSGGSCAGGVPSIGPGLSGGDESEDGEERLNRLHYCGGDGERL